MAVPVITKDHWLRLAAFCAFEVCVGVYFPSIGTMRGKMIPGEVRATLMNFFRIGASSPRVLRTAHAQGGCRVWMQPRMSVQQCSSRQGKDNGSDGVCSVAAQHFP